MKVSIQNALLLTLVLAASCATAPRTGTDGTVATPETSPGPVAAAPPEWTRQPFTVADDKLIFVVSGPEADGPAELLRAVLRTRLGLVPGPTAPALAVEELESFLKTKSQTPAADHYAQGGTGWWKVVLAKAAWEQARERLAALFVVTPADPSRPLETLGDELAAQARLFEAAGTYVSAAAAAYSEGHPPLPERFRALLTKAQDLLARLTLSSVMETPSTIVGQPWPTTFAVTLSDGGGAGAPALAGVPLRFSYKVKVNGRPAVTGQSAVTDSTGRAEVTLPVPDLAARDAVVVVIDVNPWLEALAQVPKDERDRVAAFETLAGNRKLLLPYVVESASKTVPLIVALADFDEKGGVLRRQETTSGLITGLQKAGFQASGLPVNPTLLKSPSDAVILAAWKFQGKTTGRAVYGTSSVVTVTTAGSQVTAELTGTVKVVDLATNKPVYQFKQGQTGTAADRVSAILAAQRAWTADAVAALVSDLP